ncbi:MAG: glycerol-3-phosphate dehydrogenase [Bradyrhizobium sp.]
MGQCYDIAIIGGGINGCGIARDAAGRGASVYLCDMGDLASGTSSASTKLIHGGLRYLEYYEFRLVRESLTEREVLWSLAPHIIRPLRFILPHHEGLRPDWLLRLGLFFYDHLGGRKRLPPTRRIDLTRDPAGKPLRKGRYRFGFEYSDCWVDDARLVVLNARDAADRGAVIKTRTKAVKAEVVDDHWVLTTARTGGTATEAIKARAIVNAAGPWVGQVLSIMPNDRASKCVRLVQGSHIVVPRIFTDDRCFIFQNADDRIIFAIPYEDDFTLIGTTDNDFAGDPAGVKATKQEIQYLCAAASEYFASPVVPGDVVWSYSGVRSLYDDGASAAQAATRDYVLDLDTSAGAPLLSIFGGKVTTYRRLALHALEKLRPYLTAQTQTRAGWTAAEPLPGGDFPIDGLSDLKAKIARRYPWLSAPDMARLVRAYGTRVTKLLGDAGGYGSLGVAFGDGLYASEVLYLIREEWAQTAVDVAWRRTKLGLRLTEEELARLDSFMHAQLNALATA